MIWTVLQLVFKQDQKNKRSLQVLAVPYLPPQEQVHLKVLKIQEDGFSNHLTISHKERQTK